MVYSTSAVMAAQLAANNNLSADKAWDRAVAIEFPNSISSQNKRCPKNAFLGLCQEGIVKNVPTGEYTKSEFNKQYAMIAVKLLRSNNTKTYTPIELWKEVLNDFDPNLVKQHNSQMNVVLALWNERLLNIN